MQSLNKKRKSPHAWILYGVIIGCIVILSIGVHFVRPLFIKLSRPLVLSADVVTTHVGMLDVWSLSKSELITEINTLKQENERLVLYTTDLEKQKNESIVWNTLFSGQYSLENLIRAPIISKPNQSPYDTFILDAGSRSGITAGSFMIVDSQAVLGKIDSVSETSSIGILFSSPKVTTVARLERSNYDVTLVGTGGGNMVVEVPKEIETALGDRVVYPLFHNRVIGIIRDITLDDRDANKKLYITLPTNILTLDHVYVEK